MQHFLASCHCSSIELSFSTPVTTVVNCHCHNCRRMQGSDYSTWVVIPNSQIHLLKGEQSIENYSFNSVSSKYFCKKCGTAVFGVNGKHFTGHKVVPLGIIDSFSSELAPQIQVYSTDKAQWCSLQSDVPISARS